MCAPSPCPAPGHSPSPCPRQDSVLLLDSVIAITVRTRSTSSASGSSAGSETGNWSSTMASNVWHNLTSLRFSGLLPYLEAGAGWFVQVREAMKVLMMEYNPLRRTSPHVTHKIKMASRHMSMDEVSKTYKITPVRRL